MRKRPQSKGGYIYLAQDTFNTMANRARTEADFQTMIYAYVNYIGHRNILPYEYGDLMMLKALEHGVPEAVLDMYKYHAELLYHPNPSITQKYFEYFRDKGYDSLKNFFTTIKGNHFLIIPKGFHATIIDQA
jgi:hypothetical protein